MSSILDQSPSGVVEIALHSLQCAGIELIEWGVLRYLRMDVPLVLRDFTYVVPDFQLDEAASILTSIGLPSAFFSTFLHDTRGDLVAKGRAFRITRSASETVVQHLIFYPLHFPDFARSELQEVLPSHLSPTRCSNVLVPRESAVYGSILRMMSRYPRLSATRRRLLCDLSMLNLYHLLRFTLDDVNSEEETEEEETIRVSETINRIRKWGIQGEWRQGEEWMEDALVANFKRQGDCAYFPHASL